MANLSVILKRLLFPSEPVSNNVCIRMSLFWEKTIYSRNQKFGNQHHFLWCSLSFWRYLYHFKFTYFPAQFDFSFRSGLFKLFAKFSLLLFSLFFSFGIFSLFPKMRWLPEKLKHCPTRGRSDPLFKSVRLYDQWHLKPVFNFFKKWRCNPWLNIRSIKSFSYYWVIKSCS